MSFEKNLTDFFKEKFKKVIALTLFGAISMTSMFSVIVFSKNVEITCGNDKYSFSSFHHKPDKLCSQIELKVKPGDKIRTIESFSKIDIELKEAFDVSILVDGECYIIRVTEGTVADIIAKAGIDVGEYDFVSIPLDSELFTNETIEIVRKSKIYLCADDVYEEKMVTTDTVGDAIKELGITMGPDDIANVDLDSKVYNGINLIVYRIEYVEETVMKKIPFKTETKVVPDWDKSKKETVIDGEDGSRKVRVRKKLVNGKVDSVEELESTLQKTPINKVQRVGGKASAVPASARAVVGDGFIIDHEGNKVSYSKKMVGQCTAYTAPRGARTSTGQCVGFGKVAVDPRVIPYGTKLYICSDDGKFVYGYATASDTGGAMQSGRVLVDLFYDTMGECCRLGRRTLSVYVIK